MIAHMTKLLTYRELLYNWTLREIKVRYKQSMLGVAWACVPASGGASGRTRLQSLGEDCPFSFSSKRLRSSFLSSKDRPESEL